MRLIAEVKTANRLIEAKQRGGTFFVQSMDEFAGMLERAGFRILDRHDKLHRPGWLGGPNDHHAIANKA